MSFNFQIIKTPLSLFYMTAFLKSQMFLLPVLYLFYLSNGLTTADYFLFQGLIVLMNVLLQIPAGAVGDWISRKKIVLISYTLFLGRIVCWLFWSGPWIVFIGEFLYAISKALFDTVESPYLYDLLKQRHKEHKMVQAYSKLNFALSMGTGLAALVGAWFYKTMGLQILLGTEFVLITMALLMAVRLPAGRLQKSHPAFPRLAFATALKTSFKILKEKQYQALILYSGMTVAVSHFFFWSFQPIMKAAAVPVALFGVVMCVNNMMRSFGSLLTARLLEHISLFRLGQIVFGMIVFGLCAGSVVFTISKGYACSLIFIFYLCCCIVGQLMFTIGHISRLQKIAVPEIRTQIAATNMMVARLCAAVVLILPKYLTLQLPLPTLYMIYGLLFLCVGGLLLRRVSKVAV